MQAELAAPPEHVFGAGRPFLAAQIVDFRLAEPGAEIAPQIAPVAGVAQPPLGPCAIGAADARGVGDGKECVFLLQCPDQIVLAIGREVPAGQRRARGPGRASSCGQYTGAATAFRRYPTSGQWVAMSGIAAGGHLT